MAEHFYSAFGMRIRSELTLALPPAAEQTTEQVASSCAEVS